MNLRDSPHGPRGFAIIVVLIVIFTLAILAAVLPSP